MSKIFFGLLGLAALFLLGCLSQQGGQQTAVADAICGVNLACAGKQDLQEKQAPAPQVGLSVGNLALEFQLTDADGRKLTRGSLAGKPAMIFFTTTWCVPCQIGAQNLARYDDETGGKAFNVLIVFIDDRETDAQFREFRKNFGQEDWYVAKGVDMAQSYRVQYLDTKYVFDKNGVIKWVDARPLDYESAKRVLQPLLA